MDGVINLEVIDKNGNVKTITFNKKPIAEGGEGIVLLSTDQRYIGKIYRQEIVRSADHMLEIIKASPEPSNEAYDRLAWPLYLIPDHELRVRGVVTENAGYKTWKEQLIWYLAARPFKALDLAKRGNFKGFVQIALDIAKALRYLNLKGYGHADLSGRNILVNPIEGRAVVIDLDGLVVPGHMEGSVIGTPGFIAPELVDGILQKSFVKPSAVSDRHALAVIMFQLLLWHHPLLDGSRSALNQDASLDDLLRTSSAHAVYVHDPNNNINRMKDPHIPVESLGQEMVELFRRAFVEGIKDPNARPHPSDWEHALRNLLQDLVSCSNDKCYWKYFPSLGGDQDICPICRSGAKDLPTFGMIRIMREDKKRAYFFPTKTRETNLKKNNQFSAKELFSNNRDTTSLIELNRRNNDWALVVKKNNIKVMIIRAISHKSETLSNNSPKMIGINDLIIVSDGQARCLIELDK